MEVKTVIHHKHSRILCMNCSYVKSYPITGLDRPLALHKVEVPRIFVQSAREGGKVVILRHRPPLPLGRYPWYSCLLEVESTSGPNVAGRIRSVKNPSEPIGNRTRDLLPCSSTPQSTAPWLMYAVPNMVNVRNFKAVTNQIKSYRSCTLSPHVSPIHTYPCRYALRFSTENDERVFRASCSVVQAVRSRPVNVEFL